MAAEKKRKDYDIAFKGLKDGEHLFEFKLGNTFFELFEQPQVETGDLLATVKLIKSSRMMEFQFQIEGEVGTTCDRCLSNVDVPIDYEGTIYVNFGDEYDEPTEEIVVLPHEAHTFNVAEFMYEFIVVSVPIRHVHPDNEDGTPGCDPEMLEKLNEYMVDEDSFPDSEEETEDEPIDPRWDELKKLINKNNK
ncbi:YceD family protein [Marinilabilia rubra]|uniref:Riboflavin synthase subunit alpha n=1 Tax=Marinilabilia rubra TaxID=2162893 RepID=A0A2U2BBQ3_9BACT|nr:DUF177 domain-containing protein [Marinilabilia rubra]PWE00502.1 riboflavin synthase subunit alpha [Marinilabilia rubra]